MNFHETRLSDDELIAAARRLGAAQQRFPAVMSSYSPRPIAGGDEDQQVAPGTSNPYWEIVRLLPAERALYGARLSPDGRWGRMNAAVLDDAVLAQLIRNELCMRYAWAIPTPGDIAWITAKLAGEPVVEIGAGSGYWAWQLTQAGIEVIAYDPHPPGPGNQYAHGPLYHRVRYGDHTAVLGHQDRALMLCWPSADETFAADTIAGYDGRTVIYIGEPDDGCCAEPGFFKLLHDQFEIDGGFAPEHVAFLGTRCDLSVWRR